MKFKWLSKLPQIAKWRDDKRRTYGFRTVRKFKVNEILIENNYFAANYSISIKPVHCIRRKSQIRTSSDWRKSPKMCDTKRLPAGKARTYYKLWISPTRMMSVAKTSENSNDASSRIIWNFVNKAPSPWKASSAALYGHLSMFGLNVARPYRRQVKRMSLRVIRSRTSNAFSRLLVS